MAYAQTKLLTTLSLIAAEGRTGPKLWVQRLVVWSDPGKIIRDISDLKPGLNIIWSPDTLDQDALDEKTSPNCSGKTTFCRFLRFCLGERTFGTEQQQLDIRKEWPNGRVGAQIMIDGQRWAVIRDFRDDRNDIVIADCRLEDASGREPTGINILNNAITEAIFGEDLKLMPARFGASGAWPATLAWITRDPGCSIHRLHLEWRDPSSESGSPVCKTSYEDRILVVRALIGELLTQEEVDIRNAYRQTSRQWNKNKEDSGRQDYLDLENYRAIATALGERTPETLPGTASVLINAAKERLAKLKKIPAELDVTNLKDARKGREEAEIKLHGMEKELHAIAARLEEKEKNLARLQISLPISDATSTADQSASCPLCGILIADAIASGLISSEAGHSVLESHLDKQRQAIIDEQQCIQTLKTKKAELEGQLALARQQLEPWNKAVDAFEKNNKQSKEIEIFQTQALDLDTRLKKRASASAKGAEGWKLDEQKIQLKDCCSKVKRSPAIESFSGLFGKILSELYPYGITGSIKLGKDTLTLRVKPKSSSVERIKTIAFDLAALTRSMTDNQTRFPGLLIHDGPGSEMCKESYEQLFYLARALESVGPSPLFQYIIATTTKPPEPFCDENQPWLKLKVYSKPAERRFLKVDL